MYRDACHYEEGNATLKILLETVPNFVGVNQHAQRPIQVEGLVKKGIEMLNVKDYGHLGKSKCFSSAPLFLHLLNNPPP